jgi:hypothetical protein
VVLDRPPSRDRKVAGRRVQRKIKGKALPLRLVITELRGDEVPQELMGEALRYVMSHEIAHVVGLPHNQMCNHAFPVDSLRSASFIREWGHAASGVGRTRFNYSRW